MKTTLPTRALLLILLIAILGACRSSRTKTPYTTHENVQIPATTMDSDTTFDRFWRRIDSLKNRGLPKSALAELEALKPKIDQSGRPDQTVRYVIYKVGILSRIEENSDWKNYLRLKDEIRSTTTPAKELLQLYLADFLEQWYQNQSWRIAKRTARGEAKDEDLRTWSPARFEEEINRLYKASVSNDALARYPVEYVSAIVKAGKNTRHLRPNLYDLMAHRVLEYFMRENNFLTEPAYRFTLDQPAYFDPAESFAAMQIPTRDTVSRKYFALKLFQKLTKLHLRDDVPAPLLDLELKRLHFVYQNFAGTGKDSRYLHALERLSKRAPDDPVTAEVRVEIAKQNRRLEDRKPPQTRNYAPIVSQLHDIIRLYPNTHGAGLAARILASLTEKRLTIQVEEVNLPQSEFLARIDYANIAEVTVRIFRIEDLRLWVMREDKDIQAFLQKEKPVSQKHFALRDPKDYRDHSTELALPPLAPGQYILLTETPGRDLQTPNFFQVSNLAPVSRNNSRDKLRILTRDKGSPVSGARISLYPFIRYNQIDFKSPREFTSDQNGDVTIHPDKGRGYILVTTEGTDRYISPRQYAGGGYYRGQHPVPEQRAELFLDRGIYRPGQTVYFKALLLRFDSDRIPHIRAHETAEVELRDANGQKVKSLQLRSNEYGTVHGSFTLPESGLTGNFSLRVNPPYHAYKSFRVEEYKRPRFEARLQAPEQQYSLRDTVVIKGQALNYAGAPLDGATVRYSVERHTYFPYRWYNFDFFRWWRPKAPVHIAHDQITTKPDGSFEIRFPALPDKTLDPATKPVFQFTVKASVTDITGEVHDVSTSVSIGYTRMLLDASIPDKIQAHTLTAIPIQVKNLSGQPVRAKGQAKIERLQTPETYYVHRLWDSPEYQLLSKEEFAKRFPHRAYLDEDKLQKRAVAATVWETGFDIDGADSIHIGKPLTQGAYKLTLTAQDDRGQEVKQVRWFEILATDGQAYSLGHLFDVLPGKRRVEPGHPARLHLASGADVRYYVTAFHYNKKPQKDEVNVGARLHSLEFPITEQDRGGFEVHIAAIHDNRFFQQRIRYDVPWSNKELQISFESFRDKLHPGQKEKWRIKIQGPKADIAAAEVVASLYDASLDVFARNHWNTSYYPVRSFYRTGWHPLGGFGKSSYSRSWQDMHADVPAKIYDRLRRMQIFEFPVFFSDRMVQSVMAAPPTKMKKAEDAEYEAAPAADGAAEKALETAPSSQPSQAPPPAPVVTPRTNLKETVFFMPELHTDAAGNVILEFTMNEALTRWRLMTFAHDKQMRVGYAEREVVTQKELMVIPNPPRFLREFDEMEFSAKVVNLSGKDLHPNVQLQLLDEVHTIPVYKWLDNPQFNKVIHLPKGRSVPVSFRFKVPSAARVPLIKWTVLASAGAFSDGESAYLPVVSNRMLVTETMPLPLRAHQSRDFVFKAMKKADASSTLESQSYTLEFTSNPAWYAVQALPYLMEYPHECSEQIFSRFYANTLASAVTRNHPKIQQIFEQWRNLDTEALMSNLRKNQELKNALLAETPWVMNALSEEEQKKNIALLFDLDRMAGEQEKALRMLQERQTADGGFAWFRGGRPSWYITQYIVEGIGHLQRLGALKPHEHPRADAIAHKAVDFIDRRLRDHYIELKKQVEKNYTKFEDDHLDHIVIHYLYARSFFLADKVIPGYLTDIYAYYLGQARKYHYKKGLYLQGMLALALQRNGDNATARDIMKSVKERAIVNDELGMYWKQEYGYFWYQLPIETHALMIEAFDQVTGDKEAVYQLKLWLLKNKQTTHWKTTKATASAVYALLMTGGNWLASDQPVTVRVGERTIRPEHLQAGTGYFKMSWDAESIPDDADKIHADNPNDAIAWGAVYWQYLEDLDKITSFSDTPLQLKKEVYKVTQTDRGEVLTRVKDGDVLHVGDKVKMRIELRVDRAMEYVHMKDMRAAGLEPSNVLSTYKWQDGLGYYESTRDLATDFFFSYLRPGVYVFEYPLTVQLRGRFSNGITTIQCMYAPEFTSHSNGIRITVE